MSTPDSHPHVPSADWVFRTLQEKELRPTSDFFHMNRTKFLIEELSHRFPLSDLDSYQTTWDQDHWPAWEASGLYFAIHGRHYEALSVFAACYQHLLEAQQRYEGRVHKGKALIWMSDAYWHLGWPAHAKRFLMLAFCEDLLTDVGRIHSDRGAFYAALWRHGLSETLLFHLAQQVQDRLHTGAIPTSFPESLLQDMSEDWRTELPSAVEANVYTVNRSYLLKLQATLGDAGGKGLERLAHYILTCMPGIRTRRGVRSRTAEYDIVCSLDGFEQDFRSELGRYFICECKDWSKPATLTTLAKFATVLQSAKSRFGVLFSRKGITGRDGERHASRQQMKLFQDQGLVVVVFCDADLSALLKGRNLIEILRDKYENVRLDVPEP